MVFLQYCRGSFKGIKTPNTAEAKLMKDLNQLTDPRFYSSLLTKQSSPDQPETNDKGKYRNIPDNFYIVYSTLADSRSVIICN